MTSSVSILPGELESTECDMFGNLLSVDANRLDSVIETTEARMKAMKAP